VRAVAGCAIAALAAVPTLPALADDPGKWVRHEVTAKSGFVNLLFGQPTIFGDLRSGGQANGVHFAMACIDGVTQVTLQLGRRLPDPLPKVTVVVDDREPWQEVWTVGDPFDIFIGLWTDDQAVAFLQRVLPAERLTVQLMSKYNIVTYSYDMEDAAALAGEIAERCGWTLQ
jgi:hypothetical protein